MKTGARPGSWVSACCSRTVTHHSKRDALLPKAPPLLRGLNSMIKCCLGRGKKSWGSWNFLRANLLCHDLSFTALEVVALKITRLKLQCEFCILGLFMWKSRLLGGEKKAQASRGILAVGWCLETLLLKSKQKNKPPQQIRTWDRGGRKQGSVKEGSGAGWRPEKTARCPSDCGASERTERRKVQQLPKSRRGKLRDVGKAGNGLVAGSFLEDTCWVSPGDNG